MKKSGLSTGFILLFAGLFLLLYNLGWLDFNWDYIWPMFLLVPGIAFEASYFNKGNNPGVLVPAGILMTYGVLFYLNIFWGWHLMDVLWPLFIFGVGFGLFQLYIFADRSRGLFYTSILMMAIPMLVIVLAINSKSYGLLLPGIFIVLGLVIVFSSMRDKNEDEEEEDDYDTDVKREKRTPDADTFEEAPKSSVETESMATEKEEMEKDTDTNE